MPCCRGSSRAASRGAAFYLWDAALKNGDPRIIGSLAYLTPLGSTLLLVGGAALGAGAWPRARKR